VIARVQRAIEFHLQTGVAISEQRPLRPDPPALAARLQIIALNHHAMNSTSHQSRTARHFKKRLSKSSQSAAAECRPTRIARAHGYRRAVEYLRGQRDLEGAIEQTKLDVRHYAKRQWSWFQHEPGVR